MLLRLNRGHLIRSLTGTKLVYLHTHIFIRIIDKPIYLLLVSIEQSMNPTKVHISSLLILIRIQLLAKTTY